MNRECRVCGVGPTKLDQFYKQNLCSQHWEVRKRDAMQMGHVEWLEANGLKVEAETLQQGNYDASKVSVDATGEEEIPGR